MASFIRYLSDKQDFWNQCRYALRGCSTLKEGPSLFKWYIMFYVDFSIGLVKKIWFLKIFFFHRLLLATAAILEKKQQFLFPRELLTELRYSLGLNCIMIMSLFSVFIQTGFLLSWLEKKLEHFEILIHRKEGNFSFFFIKTDIFFFYQCYQKMALYKHSFTSQLQLHHISKL